MEGWWGDLNNVQCKTIQNCHNELPLYNENNVIKMKKRKNISDCSEHRSKTFSVMANFIL
jgi:hypothetical protein